MSTILVYSDDTRFRQSCEDKLASEGLHTHFVSSEQGVIDFLRQSSKVDLVILRIRPNGEDCHHVLEYLRQIEPHVQVILTSEIFSFWNDFSSWLADECVVTSPDLTELQSSVKHFLIAGSNPHHGGSGGSSISLNW